MLFSESKELYIRPHYFYGQAALIDEMNINLVISYTCDYPYSVIPDDPFTNPNFVHDV